MSDFRYKPISESRGALAVLVPSNYSGNIASINLVDGEGNVIESGDYRGNTNGDRPTFDFSQPGYAYPADVRVQLVQDNGEEVFFNPSEGLRSGEQGPGGTAGAGGVNVGISPGGNPFVIPGAFDFTTIHTPFVDFNQILEDSQKLGEENKEKFFQNITGDPAKNAALGLIDTDLQGILKGVDTLAPRVREEGQRDLETNISRASQLDDFNLQRTGRFGEFNRAEVAKSNVFNQQQRAAAVKSSGLDYQDRITKVLDQLSQQTEGRLSDDLDRKLTTSLRNRGSDIAAATGVSTISGAGVRAQDRLEIGERVAIQNDAQKTLPGILTQAQAVLQSPEERAPTLFQQPTQVPLNVSNIADRIPVQASISAGATQLSIGDKATEIETIDAENAFGANLNTQQFNESSKFTRDLAVGDRIQGQITATDNAFQGGFNADKADAIREQQFSAFQQGLAAQQASGAAQAGGITAGIGAAQVASVPVQIAQGASAIGQIASAIPGIVNGVQQGFGAIFGPGGVFGVGSAQTTPEGAGGFLQGVSDFFGGPSQPANATPISGSGASAPVSYGGGATSENASPVPQPSAAPSTSSFVDGFQKVKEAIEDTGVDSRVLGQVASTVANWDQMNATQQLSAIGDIGTNVLYNKGFIDKETADDITRATSALNVLTNPNSSGAERAIAIAQAGAGAVTTSFTGDINAPTTIGGNRVIASEVGPDGKPAFTVQAKDGTLTSVSQAELVNSSNAMAGLSAVSILTSNASTRDKLAALSAVGVTGAAANGIISQVQAGNTLAALSILNTTQHWDEMTPLQKSVAVAQTGGAVFGAASRLGAAQASSSIGSASLAYIGPQTASNLTAAASVFGQAAAIGGAVLGYTQAASTIKAVQDMPRSQAATKAPIGVGTGAAVMGASIGSLASPLGAIVGLGAGAVVGGIIGGIAGHTGSGKNTGRIMRDRWRDNLTKLGVAKETNGASHQVTLADGSTYDMGGDGNTMLRNKGVNIDGKTERHTYDIDWSNETAVASIPDAHLFAIATGLDPASAEKMDLFHRATAQSLNMATSNTSTVEGVQGNFRALMEQMKVDPRALAMRLETLRLTNKISEEEYNVYVAHTNGIFGTQLQPSSRQEALDYFVGELSAKGQKMDKFEKELYEQLTDPEQLAESQKALEERIAEDMKDARKPKNPRKPKDPTKPLAGQINPGMFGLKPEGATAAWPMGKPQALPGSGLVPKPLSVPQIQRFPVIHRDSKKPVTRGASPYFVGGRNAR